jgi:hypothetical protein
MQIISLAGLAVVTAVIALVLREYKSDSKESKNESKKYIQSRKTFLFTSGFPGS